MLKVPVGMLAVARDSGATSTVSSVIPFRPDRVAEIVEPPPDSAVANPVELMLATVETEEFQAAWVVTSLELPSE